MVRHRARKFFLAVFALAISIVILAVFAIMGIVSGFAAGNVAGGILRWDGFIPWKQLHGLENVRRIAEATSYEVWVETEDGALFYWSSHCLRDPFCESWIPADSVPIDLHAFGDQPEIEREATCGNFDVPKLNEEQIGCVHARFRGAEAGTKTYYALTRDGEIWSWTQSAQFHLGILVLLASAFLGLTAAVILYAVVVPRRVIAWFKDRVE